MFVNSFSLLLVFYTGPGWVSANFKLGIFLVSTFGMVSLAFQVDPSSDCCRNQNGSLDICVYYLFHIIMILLVCKVSRD